jgi:heme/copper-type cytochrome/quinol oxidase subunit 2
MPFRLTAPSSFLILVVFLLTSLPSGRTDPTQVEILCHKSYFSPDTITVTRGVKVRLVLRSEDVTHGFAIDEYGIAREIPAGPPTIIEFTAERSGSFPFYCVVRCGKDHLKMRGTLTVQ